MFDSGAPQAQDFLTAIVRALNDQAIADHRRAKAEALSTCALRQGMLTSDLAKAAERAQDDAWAAAELTAQRCATFRQLIRDSLPPDFV